MSDPSPAPPDEPEENRTRTNILLLVFFVLVVGSGVWLILKLADQKKLQDCMASGRRNCAPIEAPINER